MRTVTSIDLQGNRHQVAPSELSWRPAAYAIVVDDQKILLVKEGDAYHLPGGGVDLGEAPDAAVLREVNEETGLTVAEPRLVDVRTTFFSWGALQPPHELHHVQSLLLYYACELVGGEFSTAGHDEYEQAMNLQAEWLPLAALPTITVGSTVDWRPVVYAALTPLSQSA